MRRRSCEGSEISEFRGFAGRDRFLFVFLRRIFPAFFTWGELSADFVASCRGRGEERSGRRTEGRGARVESTVGLAGVGCSYCCGVCGLLSYSVVGKPGKRFDAYHVRGERGVILLLFGRNVEWWAGR